MADRPVGVLRGEQGHPGVAAPLALVGRGFETAAKIIGGLAFVAIVAVLYRWIWRLATANSAARS